MCVCTSLLSTISDNVCMACYLLWSSSWETIFSKSSELVSPQELQCCRRLVQLCRDCLLVVYKFVSESRGSLTGLSPEWDDTRWEGHPTLLCLPNECNYLWKILLAFLLQRQVGWIRFEDKKQKLLLNTREYCTENNIFRLII